METDPDTCHERMIKRNSPRDTWKLENWDEYIKTVNFSIPTPLDDPNIKDDLLIFKNSTDKEFDESLKRVTAIIEERDV